MGKSASRLLWWSRVGRRGTSVRAENWTFQAHGLRMRDPKQGQDTVAGNRRVGQPECRSSKPGHEKDRKGEIQERPDKRKPPSGVLQNFVPDILNRGASSTVPAPVLFGVFFLLCSLAEHNVRNSSLRHSRATRL